MQREAKRTALQSSFRAIAIAFKDIAVAIAIAMQELL